MNINELYEILPREDAVDVLKSKEDELFKLIPELEACKGFDQNNDWHIYDVYEHTLQVTKLVPRQLDIRMAALFHDIGKPFVYVTDENGIGHFPKHWKASLKVFLEFANKNGIDVDMVSIVSKLIYYHDIRFQNDDDHQMDILIDSFGYDELKLLYELKKADLKAQNSKYHCMLEDLDKQEELILRRYKGMM